MVILTPFWLFGTKEWSWSSHSCPKGCVRPLNTGGVNKWFLWSAVNLKKLYSVEKQGIPDTLHHLAFLSAAWLTEASGCWESHRHASKCFVISQGLLPGLRLHSLLWKLGPCSRSEHNITICESHWRCKQRWPKESEGGCLVSLGNALSMWLYVCSRVDHIAVNKKWCFEAKMFLSVLAELVLASKEIPEKMLQTPSYSPSIDSVWELSTPYSTPHFSAFYLSCRPVLPLRLRNICVSYILPGCPSSNYFKIDFGLRMLCLSKLIYCWYQ